MLTNADLEELKDIKRSLIDFDFQWRMFKFRQAIAKAYNPNQPRVPAGNGVESGRWTDEGEGTGGASEEAAPREPRIQLAARIPRVLWNLTVRQFVSQYCKGTINRELPGQFEDLTIADILELRRGGDAAARKCFKLLNQPRFRK